MDRSRKGEGGIDESVAVETRRSKRRPKQPEKNWIPGKGFAALGQKRQRGLIQGREQKGGSQHTLNRRTHPQKKKKTCLDKERKEGNIIRTLPQFCLWQMYNDYCNSAAREIFSRLGKEDKRVTPDII